MKILARNLSRETTEAELRAMFEAFGLVEACTVVIDKETGKSKGFAFIEMPKHMDAKTAIKRLNNTSVKGSTIRVKSAEPAQ
jgi:RNA recognition motif-containing protein